MKVRKWLRKSDKRKEKKKVFFSFFFSGVSMDSGSEKWHFYFLTSAHFLESKWKSNWLFHFHFWTPWAHRIRWLLLTPGFICLCDEWCTYLASFLLCSPLFFIRSKGGRRLGWLFGAYLTKTSKFKGSTLFHIYANC